MKHVVRGVLFFILLLFSFRQVEATKTTVISSGDRMDNKIYLTFDDGYSARNTKKILDILKATRVPATFFIEGGFLTENPLLSKRTADEQILANHTFSHVDITKISDEELRRQLKQFEDEALKITGKPVRKFFRPPMGKYNDRKLKILADFGYTVFLWDVQYYDYVHNDDQGIKYVLDNLMKQTQNGSIILMHTLTNSNADALEEAITRLRAKGFVFASLEELV